MRNELGRLIYPLQQGVGVGMMCGEFIKLVKASNIVEGETIYRVFVGGI